MKHLQLEQGDDIFILDKCHREADVDSTQAEGQRWFVWASQMQTSRTFGFDSNSPRASVWEASKQQNI